MVIEHYSSMPEGQEDGYSLEGFGVPVKGITVEVKASQIEPVAAPAPRNCTFSK